MEPRIQYAKTSDGVSIAWFSVGAGLPHIWPGVHLSGIEQSARPPEASEMFQLIADRARLIRYDPRGSGLSDRGPMDYSRDAMVRDLEAVADAAGAERFTLQSWNYMSVPSLAYIERHPESVLALLAVNGLLRGADMSAGWRRLVQFAAEDWEYAKRSLAQINEAGWERTETLEHLRRGIEQSITPQSFVAFCEAMNAWDASGLVERVTAPTLVLHYGDIAPHVPRDASRRLASALPNGSFATVVRAGDETVSQAGWRAAASFFASVLPRRPRAADPPSGTSIILFADIAHSTALTERLGDAAFRVKARELDGGLRAVIREDGGTCIDAKTLGDGVLAVFASARQAIEAALACRRAGDQAGLPLHLGLHAGDVIREEGNVYGGAVNVAARISGLSAPGEVLVSDIVRGLARTSAGVNFEDRGEQSLKGVGERVRVFTVRQV
jgi:class 3 adenylate cyclase